MAISIPIFTGQLRKARLATNQANARAGYAAAVAKELETDPSHDGNYSYTYSVADAAVTADSTAATATAEGGIGDWTVDTEIDAAKNKAGDKQATSWEIVFDKDGKYLGATAKTVK